jgi:hypothetical protein
MYQVVGLVRNTKYNELREDFKPISFLPLAQDDDPPGAGATFVLRTSAPVGGVFRAITAVMAELHPGIGIQFSVLTTQLKDSLLRDRLMAALAGASGLLAVLGLYGVIAYMVQRRRNEIGVRIALGAGRARVIQLVLSEAALLLVIGLAVGVALALWAAKAAASMLYGLTPYDPVTLGGAIAVLAAVGMVASYGPAHRASHLDPWTPCGRSKSPSSVIIGSRAASRRSRHASSRPSQRCGPRFCIRLHRIGAPALEQTHQILNS